VEEADPLDVAGDRPYLDRSRTTLTSSRDDCFGEQPADALSAMLLGDDDGFQLGKAWG
jgi:hypothetical protein